MGVRYEWADEQHLIMKVTVESPWTWAEYREVAVEMMTLLGRLGHPCATILDATRIGSLPRDGSFLNSVMEVEAVVPPNLFASAMVNAPFVVAVFMEVMVRLRPRMKRMAMLASSMDEARAKVLEVYKDLYPEGQRGA